MSMEANAGVEEMEDKIFMMRRDGWVVKGIRREVRAENDGKSIGTWVGLPVRTSTKIVSVASAFVDLQTIANLRVSAPPVSPKRLREAGVCSRWSYPSKRSGM